MRRGLRGSLLALATIASAGALATARFHALVGDRERQHEAELAVDASFRRDAVAQWAQALSAEAKAFAAFPTVVACASARGDVRHLAGVFSSLATLRGLESIQLLDAKDARILGVGRSSNRFAPDAADLARARERGAALEVRPHGGTPRAWAIAPVRDDGRHVGALALELDPSESLYRFLATSTTRPGREVVLVRQDDGEVAFLTPLAGPAKPERSSAARAASAALAGPDGAGAFVDYQGVPVLAAHRRIPFTTWAVVVKVDRALVRAEALDTLVRESLVALAVLGSGLVALAAALARRRAAHERALARERARFTEVFDDANDALVVLGADGRIVQANRWGRDHFGLAAGADARAAFGATSPIFGLAPGERRTFELELAVPGGAPAPVEASVRGLAQPAGLVVAVLRDLTERRKAERALRDHETRLDAFFESDVVGILFGDVHGAIEKANDHFLELVGYDRAELEARRLGWIDLTPPEWHALDRERIAEARARGTCTPYEKEYVRKDGARVPVVVGFVLLEPDRERSVAFILDIAARKHAEEELRKLSRVVEQSPESIVITDPNGAIEYVNPRFEAVTGYARGEVLGRNPRLLKSGESPPEVYRDLWETLLRGEEWHGEFRNRRKSGEVFVERAIVSPIRGPDGRTTHYLAIKEDVTEVRRTEENLRRVQEQLVHAQRMEAMGRLAGGVAHDFNNLLTVIQGFAHLAADALGPDDPGRARLEQVLRASDRAAALTRQLLAFSKKLPDAPKTISAGRLARDVEPMLSRLLGERHAIELAVEEGDDHVRADPNRLEQVLMNLVVNARDAMPAGGTIRIAVGRRDPPAEAPAKVRAWVCVSVTDTGAGMDAETRARLFEPFFTTKGPGKGTGLGLATVYGIVHKAGGFITVESEPGRGARFDAWLPHVEGAVAAPTEAPRTRGPALPSAVVLLVEDDDLVRLYCRELLEDRGCTVLEARNGEEALALAARAPALDLVLSDVVMPGLTGPELVTRVRASRPGLPALLMSGYAGEALEDVPGDVPLLQKPVAPAQLDAAIRGALDGGGAGGDGR